MRPVTSTLDPETAAALLDSAIANVQRDYPVHWTHVITSPEDLRTQRELHPVFAGSLDWHSCVHQTWLAVRLLRVNADLPGAAKAREVLDGLLTPENCAVEADFFRGGLGAWWERPYGWAWLLTLDAELRTWSGGAQWSAALAPLGAVVRDRWLNWITGARLPVRVGTHGNTAFATMLVLEAALATGDDELASACRAAATRWYLDDKGYGGFEPDAADFLSPALTEADLLRRVLPASDFGAWLSAFVPDLAEARWARLREPATVDDPADPYGAHLAGLALSRSWAWRGIGESLPAGHPYASLAAAAAETHAELGWQYVFGYGYEGAEHWLGTFAAYLDIGAFKDRVTL
ncbi:DUF2891 family protein [Labedaea rhizosphaerae]|uniref:DUF2891 family protein n=1 Tax=Labedaea rhizosphaerae TaxID=598644 RepID=A0A4R6S857_LABRH|nr:DUF2891 family protein [Labedaea rhizosphaerae]